MIVTLDEVKSYLGIDYSDAMIDNNLNRLIGTAESYIKGAVGENYPQDNRAKELALIVISDLYDNRGMCENSSSNLRKIINDLSLQLRLESS